MTTARQRYLQRQPELDRRPVVGSSREDFAAAVVIPACDEEAWLPATLASLARNPADALAQTLVLVVVNNGAQAPAAVRAANERTLQALASGLLGARLSLAWVDAASPGCELAKPGAGSARRLGLDLALQRLRATGDPYLVCLDADTLVEPDYLPALTAHFSRSDVGGAVLPFTHQPAATLLLQTAIDRYELFLRCYVLGLQLAGSPYAFHSLGSAMACRASAYVRAGGMPRRAAAEDFYFLQQLAKTGGVAQVAGTRVHPASRCSQRVPFGTGPSLIRLLDDPAARLFYPAEAFLLLGAFLQLATHAPIDGATLQRQADALEPELGRFLREQELKAVYDRLRAHNPEPLQLRHAFHGWFDGLKSLRLLRRLCAGELWQMMAADEAVPELLCRGGLNAADAGEATWLEVLRIAQNGG